MKVPTALCALALLLAVGAAPLAAAAPAAAPETDLAQRLDTYLRSVYAAAEPGAAVIVVDDGRTLLREGYGLANLELAVPIEPDMIFRIGSVTKQFTAVAALLLVQEGRLGLEDEITKFLPDYPTKGQKITVEHLLTHTSGIKSYTGMPEWLARRREDLTIPQMVAFFQDQPMDFATVTSRPSSPAAWRDTSGSRTAGSTRRTSA